MKKILIGFVSVFLLIVILVGASYATYDKMVNVDTIYPGISINGVDVSGLSEDEALKKVHEEDKFEEKKLILKYNDQEYSYTYQNLGYNPDYTNAVKEAAEYGKEGNPGERFLKVTGLRDNPLDIQVGQVFSEKNVEEVVNHLSEVIYVEPINATFSVVNGEVITTKEQPGYTLDKEATKKLIMDSIYKDETIELPVSAVAAEVTEESFVAMNGDIGLFSTNYSSSVQNRKENIKLAAKIIDGTVIMPGQQISFNDIIGEISAATGFLPATVITNGEFDTGTGGGICQVSTTLYNAAVRADLQIDERRNHSRPVNYVPMGLDAAVASGQLDLKITNTFDFPVFISAKADNDNIEFKIIGDKTKKNYDIELVSERTQTLQSSTKNEYSSSLEKGATEVKQSGNTGYRYASYKIKKINGETVDTQNYLNSYYPARDTIIIIGTKEGSASAPSNETIKSAEQTPQPKPEPKPEESTETTAPSTTESGGQ